MSTANPPMQPPRKTDMMVVLISYLSFIALGLPGGMQGIAWYQEEWSSIRGTFALDLGALFPFLLVSTIGYSTASFICGRLFARYSPATVFAAGTLLAGIGFLAFALAPSWGAMVAFGLLAGFGGGLVDGGMNIYFAAFFGPRLMNWLHACFGIGLALGAVVMTIILKPGGLSEKGGSWQTGYMLAFGLYAVLAILFFVSRSRWMRVVGSHSAANTEVHASATLKLPVVWLGILIFMAYAGLESVPNNWLNALFQRRGVEDASAATWVSLYLASFTIGRIFFGIIVTQFNPVKLIRACIGIMILMVAALLLNLLPDWGWVWVCVYGFVVAPIFALLITNTQEQLGAAHAANAIGFYVGAASAGFGFLPGVAGLIADRSSLEIVPPFMLVMALLLAGLYLVISSSRLRHLVLRGVNAA
ncbi:MAG: MFS transporter [Anaerolineae bacterium]